MSIYVYGRRTCGQLLTPFRFFGPLVKEQMLTAADNVEIAEVFDECGHSLSLEQPERLAKLLKRFVLSC